MMLSIRSGCPSLLVQFHLSDALARTVTIKRDKPVHVWIFVEPSSQILEVECSLAVKVRSVHALAFCKIVIPRLLHRRVTGGLGKVESAPRSIYVEGWSSVTRSAVRVVVADLDPSG